MKTLVFWRVLTNYRTSFFKKLNKTAAIIFCFGRRGPQNTFLLKVEADFPHCQMFDFFPFEGKDTLGFQNVVPPLLRYKPEIVITELALANISNWLLLLLQPFFKFKLILWGHGNNRKTGFDPQRFLKDKVKFWFMEKADALIFYSKEGKAAVSKYLTNRDKAFVAPNTLDTQVLTEIRKEMEKNGKDAVKRNVGFCQKYNFIYLGRVIEEKEPDRLINIFKIISKSIDSVELHIVGDGPLIDKLKTESKDLKVKFWGNIKDEYKIGSLLFASDLMVIPGYLGLAIVHSFCFDLPVVSQRKGANGPFHSPEIGYLIDGKTGFLTECGDEQLMVKVIVEYLNDPEKQAMMKKEIRSTVENTCRIDNMIDGFNKAINYAGSKI